MKDAALTKSPYLLLTACLLAGMSHSPSVAGQERQQPIKPPMVANPQQGEDEGGQEGGTRRLWDEGLMKTRRAPRTSKPRRDYKYRRVTPELSVKPNNSGLNNSTKQIASAVDRVVGITFWRLRPSVAGDEARLPVQEQGRQANAEWTPERIAAEMPLKEGQFVRLSIEAPQSGYLYVVDREKYADGSLGEPYLIFPTLRTNGGDNRVEAGRVIEIPAQDDNPSYFTMRPSSPKQVAEVLTVIVSEQPLDVPALQRNAVKLRAEKVRGWEQAWKTPVERIEQVGGLGAAWTAAEKEAGQGGQRRLTQDEPLPQTIYHVAIKLGQPVFINVPLLYSSNQN
jgi:hypothetical protein